MYGVCVTWVVFHRDNYIVSLPTWALTHVQQLRQTRPNLTHYNVRLRKREREIELVLPSSLLFRVIKRQSEVLCMCHLSYPTNTLMHSHIPEQTQTCNHKIRVMCIIVSGPVSPLRNMDKMIKENKLHFCPI